MSILSTFTKRPFFENLNKKWQDVFLNETFKTEYSHAESYLFAGTFGTGKTHTAVILMREYAKATYPNGYELSKYAFEPSFINFERLLAYIQDYNSFDSERRYSASLVLEELLESSYLVIDDFDTMSSTDNKEQNLKDYIYRLFEKRYNENLTTVVTTNRNFNELIDFYTGKVVDRLVGLCQIVKSNETSKRTGINY